MTRRMPKVTILPYGLNAEVPPESTLLDAGEAADLEMEAGCFNCSCGTCVVEVVEGMDNLLPPTPKELDVLDEWNRDSAKYRLACCTRVRTGNVVIRQLH